MNPQTHFGVSARYRLVPLILLVLAVAGGCRRGEHASAQPSVLLITVDTLRPDRLSTYGYTQAKTPAFDALAADGAVFETAVCDIPWTTGSMASVMTGTFSTQHGVHLPNERLSEARVTLAELLKARGYDTGAVIGSFPVASLYGLNQGFDSYDEEFNQPLLAAGGDAPNKVERIVAPQNTNDAAAMMKWAFDKMNNDAYRPDAEVSAHAVAWLRAHRSVPFFLWVHFFGPHERLLKTSPVSDQEPRLIAEYDTNLQATNAALGQLLSAVDELKLKDRTLVVLHADHGQSLGEHGLVGHGIDIYEASTRIPLLMRFPGHVTAGTRVPALVRNVDILPTILSLVGVPVPDGLNGRSLAPVFAGNSLSPVPAYIESYTTTVVFWPIALSDGSTVLGPVTRRAIREGRWKFIENRFSKPCTKGSSPHRARRLGAIDLWEVNAPVALPAEECNGLRVEELYDLGTDAHETHNVLDAHPEVAAELRAVLARAADQKTVPEKIKLSPQDQERLRSLGYNPGTN